MSNSGKMRTRTQAISSLVRTWKTRNAVWISSRPRKCTGIPRFSAADNIAFKIGSPVEFLDSLNVRCCFTTMLAGEQFRMIAVARPRIHSIRSLHRDGTVQIPQSSSRFGPEKSVYPILLCRTSSARICVSLRCFMRWDQQ